MKLIFKNFIAVLKRFKASNILNILGLAVAFAVFYVVAVQVYYDFSFDRNFENADDIYLISFLYPERALRSTSTNLKIPEEFAQKCPEIQSFCSIWSVIYKSDITVADDDGKVRKFTETITSANAGLVDVFNLDIIAGDAVQALTANNMAMLTESVAKKFFGNEDPLGKTFSHSYGVNTVVAICRDFPDNCSLKNGIYTLYGEATARDWAFDSYIKTSPGSRDKILDVLQPKDDNSDWLFELTALPDIHLKFPTKGKGDFSTTVSLMAIGILLLLIAYINYTNFSVAMAPVRLKGFNIRRIMGEGATLLRFSIMMEAALISFIAFAISLFLIRFLFNSGVIKEYFQADLSLLKNLNFICIIAGTSVIMGLIAGIYPACYSTHFKPAMALSGSFTVSAGSKTLRNILIGFQFTATVFLIIVSIFIKIQHDYMVNRSWGLDKSNIVYFNMSNYDIGSFENELRKSPDIVDFTCSSSLPGQELMMEWGHIQLEDATITKMTVFPVYPNYLKFFGAEIIEGRDFTEEDGKGDEKMIFNRNLVKEYGLNDVLGKYIQGMSSPAEITGIVKDFHFKSLRESITPFAFVTGQSYTDRLRRVFVKINGQNRHAAIKYIKDTGEKFGVKSLEISFLDEWLDNLYERENNFAKLISIFVLITIIVAVMGVYGLILFNVKSKRKTIALHKIHGASVREVILMLNRGFIVQFAAAYIVAVPVAYIAVNRWLENFAYKTAIHWWVFVLGGLLVFLITVLTVSRQSYRAATENPIEGIKME
jgi:putative ABC transport system permease protein